MYETLIWSLPHFTPRNIVTLSIWFHRITPGNEQSLNSIQGLDTKNFITRGTCRHEDIKFRKFPKIQLFLEKCNLKNTFSNIWLTWIHPIDMNLFVKKSPEMKRSRAVRSARYQELCPTPSSHEDITFSKFFKMQLFCQKCNFFFYFFDNLVRTWRISVSCTILSRA